MALLFAAHRWSATPGSIDYAAEAQAILDAMRNDDRGGEITAIFHPIEKQAVFAPTKHASRFTDPSYHLPAFYELWARWDRTGWAPLLEPTAPSSAATTSKKPAPTQKPA